MKTHLCKNVLWTPEVFRVFIIYGRRGRGGISRPIVVGGATFFLAYFLGGTIFFNALFLLTFFHESDITCIITAVGAQQQHKGMFFLNMGRGGKFFQQCHEGGRLFSRVFSRGGALFFAYRFCRTPPPPSAPAINNERSLTSCWSWRALCHSSRINCPAFLHNQASSRNFRMTSLKLQLWNKHYIWRSMLFRFRLYSSFGFLSTVPDYWCWALTVVCFYNLSKSYCSGWRERRCLTHCVRYF